jgi:hypothetical protein
MFTNCLGRPRKKARVSEIQRIAKSDNNEPFGNVSVFVVREPYTYYVSIFLWGT